MTQWVGLESVKPIRMERQTKRDGRKDTYILHMLLEFSLVVILQGI